MDDPSDKDNDKDKDCDSISVSGSSYSGTTYMDDTLTDRAEGPARSAYVDPVVAEEEERQVKRSRLVVIAVLIVSLAILASAMYFIVSRGEHETFKKQVRLIEFRRLCFGWYCGTSTPRTWQRFPKTHQRHTLILLLL
jgi:hypothetical protein